MSNGDRLKCFCKVEKCLIFSGKSTNVSLCPMAYLFVQLKNVLCFQDKRTRNIFEHVA